MSRGAYKQYEYDPAIPMPRSTCHTKKRKQEETDQNMQTTQASREHEEWNHTVGTNTMPQSQSMRLSGEENQELDYLVSDGEANNTDESGADSADNDSADNDSDDDDEATSDVSENEDTDNNQDFENGNCPIYPGAAVTKNQSLLLILSFMLRHKLTDVALADLLLLLNTFFPNTVPSTKYKFYKSFRMENSEIHYYCSSCKSYMGEDPRPRQCESCEIPFCGSKSMKEGNYFIYIPVKQQIEAILSDPSLFSFLTDRCLETLQNTQSVDDVTTSGLYKKLIESCDFTGNDISLTWNTDGIPIFKSSKFSIWPLQAFLNELPPHIRGKNILLMGLWFGGKPVMNTFLKPFVNECSELEDNGFLFAKELRPRKVFSLFFCGDAPARAIVKNVKQYNGAYGCDWCESPGVTAQPHGRGPPARYYPHRTPVLMRTSYNQALYAIQALPNHAVKGVKGLTVVDLLPTFDTVKGVAADYMHCVCQGVTKHMVNLWLDSKNHTEGFYIGRKVPLLDERLLKISPPSEMHRAPRSLTERCYWKASEWRAFLFYSLIILQGILPTKYLNHFFLYVNGIYTLLGDSISDESIILSEVCLTKFVIQAEELYGLTCCTFNLHCLTHLSQCVKNCGPLWATSAFTFEAHNHVLVNMFGGTQSVPHQIVHTFLLQNKVTMLTRSSIDQNCCPAVINAICKLTDKSKYKHNNVCDGLTALGSERFIMIDARTTLAVQNLIKEEVVNRSAVFYDRFLYNHNLYSGKNYTREKRHSNCNVSFVHPNYAYGVILGLLNIKPSCQCDLGTLQYCDCTEYKLVIIQPMVVADRMLFRDLDFNVCSRFIPEVIVTEDVIAILPSQIQRKCIRISLENKTYTCALPYRIYGD